MVVAPAHPKGLYLLDIKEVIKRTSLSRSTIWRRLRSRSFPQPVRLSEQCVRWRADEVDSWIRNLPARQE
ncbi:AlpA family phage regulatory protein [Acetobacter senegalensis]|nr:AlpA family phage regulatory protein [Acetobacter senegalensis]MCG4260723.1 AlpA family phage regulatory protein [Acetobacter senegalensis]